MNLSHLGNLHAVEVVLRRGSFRAAADELGVTPAAVGQRIRALEDYVGQRLFDRLPERVRPTELALRIASDLQSGFAGVASAFAEMSAPSEENRLSLSLTATIANHWLPPHLMSFLAGNPDSIDLRLNIDRTLTDMRLGDVDFSVRHTQTPDTALNAALLFRERLVPICTPDFAERYGLNQKSQTLEGVPLIHIDAPEPNPAWGEWGNWAEQTGIPAPSAGATISYSKDASAVRIARAGLGLVLGGTLDLVVGLRDGTLIAPLGPRGIVVQEHAYWLVWSRARRLSPIQRAFRDYIVAAAESDRAMLPNALTSL